MDFRVVLNNFDEEFKKLLKMSGKSQTEIAKITGMQRPNVGRTAKLMALPQRYVEVMEAMGYDLKVTYVKRGAKENG